MPPMSRGRYAVILQNTNCPAVQSAGPRLQPSTGLARVSQWRRVPREATTSSDPVQSGPVIDASLGWIAEGSDGGMWLRLHGRYGLTDDNNAVRTYFVSFGTELRLNRSKWTDRN